MGVRESRNPRALPSGHLEDGESVAQAAVREAAEQVGVDIDPADLDFTHVVHPRNPEGQGRIGIFFTTARWAGEPVNRNLTSAPGSAGFSMAQTMLFYVALLRDLVMLSARLLG
jgi:ADP-ribose pyrophosphatase YjhB (NUDIX family)